MSKSANQNTDEVELSNIKRGGVYPISTSHGRVQAEVLYANHSANEYYVRYNAAFEEIEEVVPGESFVPKIQEIENPVSDVEFEKLEPGTTVRIFATDYQNRALGVVQEVDRENNRISFQGECRGLKLSRWVDQEFVKFPRE